MSITYERMLREIDENWSAPDRRRTPRNSSLFLQRDLNDDALRQPAPLSFTQAELDRARQEGFEVGQKAGLEAAAASREAAEAAALQVLTGLLVTAGEASAAAADRAGAALARALLGGLGAVMPELVRRSALDEAGAMLAVVLPGLSREPAITVEVPPEIEAGIGALIAGIAPELSDRVAVTGVGHLAHGEVRVRWSAGQARRSPAAVWQTVMDRLEPALGAAATAPVVENTYGD